MPRAATIKEGESVEDFRKAIVQVGLKLCDKAIQDTASDRDKNLENIAMLFNAIKYAIK